MKIQERIAALRHLMSEKNVDVYIVPSADNHQSEYVGEHFKCRSFITGFTGSAGTAVVTKDKIGLWTDGRYFIQAEKELSGTEIQLFKSGNPGVPTIDEYLDSVFPENGTLGFDGRVVSASDGKKYEEKFAYKNICIESRFDLINPIWDNRPSMSKEAIFLLGEAYIGETTASKLKRIREKIKTAGATAHLLITLDDIAWLLNFRGRDTAYTPVALCYAVIMMNSVHLFMDRAKISDDILNAFAKDTIILHSYNDVYEFLKNLDDSEVILVDPLRLNYALYRCLSGKKQFVEGTNPTILFKAMKNETEIKNTRLAHIKDAVAHTKFMYWIKTRWDKENITELSASDKLESLRAEQEHFLWPSFEPISAFGANAAMCHYSSSEGTNVPLTAGSFFLTDTGGHYLEGSTDITRTVAIGEISEELKKHFTNVLRGNLALSKTKFLYGCTGENLDILARQYLWQMNLDYKHGTGHGVGNLLSVHEGPCNIRWQHRDTAIPLEEGMILSDEPGIYIENSHGIRLENELLIQKDVENEYGQFMKFEVLTFVPFDLDAIDVSLLQDEEIEQLNTYHQKVYDIVSPYLNEDEKNWLKVYTRKI